MHDSVFVRATTASAAATRLGVRDREKICPLERATPRAYDHCLRRNSLLADRDWFFTRPSAPFRSECTLARAKEQPRRAGVASDHGENASPLGAGARNRAGGRR